MYYHSPSKHLRIKGIEAELLLALLEGHRPVGDRELIGHMTHNLCHKMRLILYRIACDEAKARGLPDPPHPLDRDAYVDPAQAHQMASAEPPDGDPELG